MKNIDLENIDLDAILCDKKKFHDFVYTPLEEAVLELERRQNDSKLKAYISKSLPAGIPAPLTSSRNIFLSRSLATPNYELRRFMAAVDSLGDFRPVFWEYWQDDFRPNVNESKHNIAKMTFYQGLSKNGMQKILRDSIVDFNTENGKKLADVKTRWGQGLVDFHHDLFNKEYADKFSRTLFYDASEWYKQSGGDVNTYYKYIFILFLAHGILFENYLPDHPTESSFVRNVFLPTFLEIIKESGYKPLIVAMEPTDMEGHDFWMYYPHKIHEHVKVRQNLI